MAKNKNQDAIKEIIGVMKEDYKTPGKLLIWGMAIGQWIAILIIAGLFLSVLVFFIFTLFESKKEVPQSTKQQVSIEQQTAIIKDISKFLEVSASSINARQSILESLMETIKTYADRELDQNKLEQKLKILSSNLSICNSSRGLYISKFSKNINPFEMPEISEEFKELIGHRDIFNRHAIDPEADNQQWKSLCQLCQNEVNKANDALVKLLNVNGVAEKDEILRK